MRTPNFRLNLLVLLQRPKEKQNENKCEILYFKMLKVILIYLKSKFCKLIWKV